MDVTMPVASTSRAHSPSASAIAQLADSIAAIAIPAPRLNPLSAPYVPTGILAPADGDADAQILEALRSAKDRIFVLKLGEAFEALIADRPTRMRLECSAQTTYQRLLVHRCAAYYRLAIEQLPDTKALVVLVVEASKVPTRRLSDLVPTLAPSESSQPTFKIMRRDTRSSALSSTTSTSSLRGDESADVSDSESVPSQRKKRERAALTIAEREAAYNAARERIFRKPGADETESVDESEFSVVSTSTSADVGAGARGRESVKRQESGANSVSGSQRASPKGAANAQRKGRGRSTSPEYVPYDPAQHGSEDAHAAAAAPPPPAPEQAPEQQQQPQDGGQYTPYGAVYSPAGFHPAMYAVSYFQYAPPDAPPPPQQQQQQVYGPPPPPPGQYAYGPYGWVAGPTLQQQQSAQQYQQPQQVVQYQLQQAVQPAGAPYPPPAAYPQYAPQPSYGPPPPHQYGPPPPPPPQQQQPQQQYAPAPPPPPPPSQQQQQQVPQLQFGTAPPAPPIQTFVPPPVGAAHAPVAINGAAAPSAYVQQQQPQGYAPASNGYAPQQQQQQQYPTPSAPQQQQTGYAVHPPPPPPQVNGAIYGPPQQQQFGPPPQQQQQQQQQQQYGPPLQQYGPPPQVVVQQQQQQSAFAPPPPQQLQQHYGPQQGFAPMQQAYGAPYAYGPGQPQQHQTQGSIQFGRATPYYGPEFAQQYPSSPQINGARKTSGRTNAAMGPRMARRAPSSSSSVATSASSSASGGARTPADETASVASSVASSSSSSSRKTFTSTASGTHPLPARPDWAIGMKPSPPARHPGLPRHHHHHGQQRPRAPHFGSADFPPLSGSGGAGPSARGAWARPMAMGQMEYERPPAKGDVELYNPRAGRAPPAGGGGGKKTPQAAAAAQSEPEAPPDDGGAESASAGAADGGGEAATTEPPAAA